MANDDFQDMISAAGHDAKSKLDARIGRERRIQKRARRIRRICRFTILLGGPSGILLLWLGLEIEIDALVGIGCFLFFPTFVAATILFWMGGLAPTSLRRHLSDRERDRLDH